MRLGMRTYRISCMDVTDSICRMRCNTQSTYCKFQVNRAGRRRIESVALCVWQCHLRSVSTLSNRTRAKRHAPASFSCPRESPLVPTRIAARAHENRGSCPRGIALVVNPATTLRDRIGTNSFIHEIWLKQTILCERCAPIDNRAICNVHRLGHLNWCELSDLIPFQVFEEAAFLQPEMSERCRPFRYFHRARPVAEHQESVHAGISLFFTGLVSLHFDFAFVRGDKSNRSHLCRMFGKYAIPDT